MARLVGLAVLGWAIYASIGFAVANAPQPTAIVAQRAEQPLLADAIADAVVEPVVGVDQALASPGWGPGAYAVGDSPNRRIAARDHDYRPRTNLFAPADGTIDDDWADDDWADDDRADDDRADDDRAGDRDEEAKDVPAAQRMLVQGEIPPGLYTTSFAADDCSYELWRVLETRDPAVIGEEYLASGRLLVTINGIEPDWFTSTASCGEWRAWTPQPDPLTAVDNGDYWIGDLATGTWLVPRSCRWEKVVGFRGGFLYDVVDQGDGPGAVVIDSDTLGVRVRGCRQPLTLSNFTVDIDIDPDRNVGVVGDQAAS